MSCLIWSDLVEKFGPTRSKPVGRTWSNTWTHSTPSQARTKLDQVGPGYAGPGVLNPECRRREVVPVLISHFGPKKQEELYGDRIQFGDLKIDWVHVNLHFTLYTMTAFEMDRLLFALRFNFLPLALGLQIESSFTRSNFC